MQSDQKRRRRRTRVVAIPISPIVNGTMRMSSGARIRLPDTTNRMMSRLEPHRILAGTSLTEL
jgi:hypothetical protein